MAKQDRKAKKSEAKDPSFSAQKSYRSMSKEKIGTRFIRYGPKKGSIASVGRKSFGVGKMKKAMRQKPKESFRVVSRDEFIEKMIESSRARRAYTKAMKKKAPQRYRTDPHGDATFKGSYYRWKATRGHAMAGGDPVTGHKKGRFDKPHDTAAYKASHKAMAKSYLKSAKKMRKTGKNTYHWTGRGKLP